MRVVIVGAGLMGRWHAHDSRRAGGRLVGVVDDDEGAAASLAGRGAVARAPSDDWLAELQPEVVHVCTPCDSHFEIARGALTAGAHAVVEKPLASSPDRIRALAEEARSAERLLVPVHQLPFQRSFDRLRRERRRIADPVRVVYRTCTAGADGREGQARREVLLEILPHPISLLNALELLPSVEAWRVVTFSDDALELAAETEGASSEEVRLRVVVELEARPIRSELEVHGRRATALIDLFHDQLVLDEGVGRPGKIARPLRLAARRGGGAVWNLARRALTGQRAYPGLGRLIAAAYTSMRESGTSPVDVGEAVAAAELVARLRPRRGVD